MTSLFEFRHLPPEKRRDAFNAKRLADFLKNPRKLAMISTFRATSDLQTVADQFGVTRERARQIIALYEHLTGSEIGERRRISRWKTMPQLMG